MVNSFHMNRRDDPDPSRDTKYREWCSTDDPATGTKLQALRSRLRLADDFFQVACGCQRTDPILCLQPGRFSPKTSRFA